MDKEEMKELIEIFYDKWVHSNSLWRNDFYPNIGEGYLGFNIKISFGQGIRIVPPNSPWMAFLKYEQQVRQGIYPIIIIENDSFKVFLGVSRDNDPNLDISFIDKVKNKLGLEEFSIEKIDQLVNHLVEKLKLFNDIFDFRKKYEEFTASLPSQNSGQYALLYTPTRQTPFKLYKNGNDGIAIRALTEQPAAMSTNFNQLFNVNFDNGNLWYPSYEPVIIDRIKNGQIIEEQEIRNENGEEFELDYKIKNIILYGVPGVGKTHNIAKLISLIEEGRSESKIFDAIRKNEYYGKESLEDMQDRVEFVTFHQSFGYEDFIEGFRPNEEGKIELIDGIFKSLSLRAKENLKKSSASNSFDFERFLNDYVAYVENQEKFSLEEKLFLEVSKNSNGDFVSFKTKGRVKDQSLSKKIIQRDFEKFLNAEIKQYQDIKPTYESKSSYHGNAPYYFKLFENMKSFMEKQGKENYQAGEEDRKNYYLIIDEINRGNISKIFGELITLIEEDKRDTYEVTLPYSKEKFSVPSNLYIIGTMNSTDKSIALIDIALRRRFTFLKMQSNDSLVPDFAKDLFVRLNEKIKKKLGDEYQIGHSYFMNIADGDALDFVLEYKIKPLLEEYFYGDEAGLKDVLSVIEERGE